MGVGYCLVNKTKKEKISYLHLSVNKAKELVGNPVSSAITTWYLIKNAGDEIGFITDQCYEENRPYKDIAWKEISTFKDLINDIVDELIEIKILTNHGIEILDEKPPGTYEICKICFWEDDNVQFCDPDCAGGANNVSLRQGQKIF